VGIAASSPEMRLSKLILDSYLSKGREPASFERCTDQQFRSLLSASKNQRIIPRRNQKRMSPFPPKRAVGRWIGVAFLRPKGATAAGP
jgi:hypothetical protein